MQAPLYGIGIISLNFYFSYCSSGFQIIVRHSISLTIKGFWALFLDYRFNLFNLQKNWFQPSGTVCWPATGILGLGIQKKLGRNIHRHLALLIDEHDLYLALHTGFPLQHNWNNRIVTWIVGLRVYQDDCSFFNLSRSGGNLQCILAHKQIASHHRKVHHKEFCFTDGRRC